MDLTPIKKRKVFQLYKKADVLHKKGRSSYLCKMTTIITLTLFEPEKLKKVHRHHVELIFVYHYSSLESILGPYLGPKKFEVTYEEYDPKDHI